MDETEVRPPQHAFIPKFLFDGVKDSVYCTNPPPLHSPTVLNCTLLNVGAYGGAVTKDEAEQMFFRFRDVVQNRPGIDEDYAPTTMTLEHFALLFPATLDESNAIVFSDGSSLASTVVCCLRVRHCIALPALRVSASTIPFTLHCI